MSSSPHLLTKFCNYGNISCWTNTTDRNERIHVHIQEFKLHIKAWESKHPGRKIKSVVVGASGNYGRALMTHRDYAPFLNSRGGDPYPVYLAETSMPKEEGKVSERDIGREASFDPYLSPMLINSSRALGTGSGTFSNTYIKCCETHPADVISWRSRAFLARANPTDAIKRAHMASRLSVFRGGKGRAKRVSSYRGVSWDAQKTSWRASISFHGTSHFLGRFVDERQAAHAYDAAAVALHGGNALLNFIHEREICPHKRPMIDLTEEAPRIKRHRHRHVIVVD